MFETFWFSLPNFSILLSVIFYGQTGFTFFFEIIVLFVFFKFSKGRDFWSPDLPKYMLKMVWKLLVKTKVQKCVFFSFLVGWVEWNVLKIRFGVLPLFFFYVGGKLIRTSKFSEFPLYPICLQMYIILLIQYYITLYIVLLFNKIVTFLYSFLSFIYSFLIKLVWFLRKMFQVVDLIKITVWCLSSFERI